MPPGPKPQPAALKIARGNPGKESKAKLNRGLKLKPATPAAPEYLGEVARREWNRLVPQLAEIGLLAGCDAHVLALYCETLAEWINAIELCRMKPWIGKAGTRRNPAYTTANEAANKLIRLMGELGLSPAARVRLNNTNADKPKDEFESFVSKAG